MLLADVEGSTRLWETQPEAMKAAVERLDQTLSEAVAAHDGVRPVEQGEGDSFVIAFARAADAVACALELQRAPLAPIKLRIGVHTGDVNLRDEGNYIGPTINRTARLRDLGPRRSNGLVGCDGTTCRRPVAARRHAQRPRHPSVARPSAPRTRNPTVPSGSAQRIPAASYSQSAATEHLPVQLTSFIGRRAEMTAFARPLATTGS